MRNSTIRLYFTATILVVLQIWIFSPVSLFQIATPTVYPLILLFIPMDWRPISLTLFGFCIGCIIDYFSFTPGLHASTFSLVAFLRHYLLKLKLDAQDNISMPAMPSEIKERSYLLLLELLGIHHTLLFLYSTGLVLSTTHFFISLGASLVFSMLLACVILFCLSVRVKPLKSHDK